jgi:hypothetical protein
MVPSRWVKNYNSNAATCEMRLRYCNYAVWPVKGSREGLGFLPFSKGAHQKKMVRKTALIKICRVHCTKQVRPMLKVEVQLKMYWVSRGTAPRILNLGTWWRQVISFTPPPLYPRGKSCRYQLDTDKSCVSSKLDSGLSIWWLYKV